jgi:phosphinothricin acetyltransferase
MASRIEKTLSLWPWLVAEDEGKVLGYAYASQHRTRASYRWAVDAGIYIDAAAHGRGVGRALYTSLIAMLRDQRFRTVYGGITLPNAKSIALHEAMGFQLIGIYRNVGFKNGAWRDVGWWGLDLGARDGVPAEPLPLAALDVARYLI